MRRKLSGVLLCMTLIPLLALGQEFRATVTGVVTDSSKAAIQGAVVTVRNLDTNQTTTAKTNNDGSFTVPFLRPGQKYEVAVEAPGFKKSIHPPITMQIGQVVTTNFELQVGGSSENVTVTADAPMLDLAKADRGSVVDNKTITELPLNGRNPLALAMTVAGVTFEGGDGWAPTPWDTYGGSMFSVNGGKNMNNEFLLDGMPNNAFVWYANGVSSVPSVDAMQEFKIITNPYDAQYGRTAGGIINMSLKSGGNKLHGSVYEFARRTWLDANDWYDNAWDQARPEHKEDQYGFQLDGPVYIPKVYDGRNKTFFMFNMERFRQTVPPDVRMFAVPDPAWLTGDFSNLRDASGNLIPIFDPTTTVCDPNNQNNCTRQQFQNNQIPLNRLDPIALNILKNYYPAPNMPSPDWDPNTKYWMNNNSTTHNYDSYIAKIDQNFGTKDRAFFNFTRSNDLTWNYWSPKEIGANGSLPYKQETTMVGFDWVHTFSSNVLFNLHGNWQRYFRNDNVAANKGFDITQLGFSQAVADMAPFKNFPMVEPDGYMSLSRDWYLFPNDSTSFLPNLTWVHGKHTMKFGFDFRVTHYADQVNWTGGYEFSFNNVATRQYWDSDGADPNLYPSQDSGNSIASMLLGLSSNVAATNKLNPYYTWRYYAPWFQDDWKVTEKLTLNLGLRWDINGPVTERHNRISYGFDTTAVNPINASIHQPTECATYDGTGACTAYYPTLPTLMGGTLFAGVDGNPRSPYRRDWNNIQPRFGLAYQVLPKTVLRMGFGSMYMNPIDTANVYGFQNDPTFVSSLDGGRTFVPNSLDNPFPQGIQPPPGSSLGLLTNVGQGMYYRQQHYQIPHVWQYSAGLEQELPKQGSLELSYVGSHSYQQETIWNGFNDNPTVYASCDVNQGGNKANCTNRVPNPFYQVPGVASSLSASPTVSLYQLARPYPEFTTVGERLLNDGESWYNSLQAVYRQHLSWLDLNGSYTWSKNMDKGGYIDQIYQIPLRSLDTMDRTHRITVSSVFQIPVGRGKYFFPGMNKVLDAAVGGWEVGSSWIWQTGQPWNLPSGYNVVGNFAAPKGSDPGTLYAGVSSCAETWNNSTSTWSPTQYSPDGCSMVFQQKATYAPNVTQPTTGKIRIPGYTQLDANLAKNFKLMEGLTMQLRLEGFNVLNHPTWNFQYDNSPTSMTFGTIEKSEWGQSNQPRQVQLGLKLLW